MTQNETVNRQNLTVATTTGQTVGCYDYWVNTYPAIPLTTTGLYWSLPQIQDKGKQAYEIVKQLMKTDLVQVKTAKQFMELMDVVLKAI